MLYFTPELLDMSEDEQMKLARKMSLQQPGSDSKACVASSAVSPRRSTRVSPSSRILAPRVDNQRVASPGGKEGPVIRQDVASILHKEII